MPVLSNPRHERFAQELAKGKTADEAYQAAGYSENRGNAARLKANENILRRVAELQERGAIRAEVTVESLLAESDEVMRLAIRDGQYSAAMAAIREKGVLSGRRVERSEHGQPGEFESIDDPDEIRRRLIELAEAAGEGAIAAQLAFGAEEAEPEGRLN